ncbi:GNAT family N-acetyltransferase [bacterium]|nr:GNAT family N-acetyltransferase [bacterium]
MKISFTPARLQDAPTLARLDKESFGAMAWPEDSFRSALRNPLQETEMAVADGKTLGYVLMNYQREAPSTACVDSLAVSPDARGQKLGEQLLLRGLETAANKGFQEVQLEVEKGNAPAEKLYEKYGFVPTGLLSGYYNGKDGTQMKLKDLQGTGAQLLAQRRQELAEKLGGIPSHIFTTAP